MPVTEQDLPKRALKGRARCVTKGTEILIKTDMKAHAR
jgi:hypothetical protein